MTTKWGSCFLCNQGVDKAVPRGVPVPQAHRGGPSHTRIYHQVDDNIFTSKYALFSFFSFFLSRHTRISLDIQNTSLENFKICLFLDFLLFLLFLITFQFCNLFPSPFSLLFSLYTSFFSPFPPPLFTFPSIRAPQPGYLTVTKSPPSR